MAQKISFTDIVHNILRDSEESLSLDEVIERLHQAEPDNQPKNPRSTVRSAVRTSGLIQAAGKNRYAWLPRRLKGARLRHTLTESDFEQRNLNWDTDLLVALWPAFEEPERRRERDSATLTTESETQFCLSLEELDGRFFSHPETDFWGWLSECKAEPGDDLIITITDGMTHAAQIRYEARATRAPSLIEERNKFVERRIETFLTTCRDGLAKPQEIAADLLACHTYHDSVPPLSLSALLPQGVVDRFGQAVTPDNLKSEKCSNVIQFPKKMTQESLESQAEVEDHAGGSLEFPIPLNSGQELPDEKAYVESLELLQNAARPSPALAIHVLGVSRLCSPAYAFLSQTAEFRREALDLAGQSVIAAERRIAHGLVESLVSGEEFAIEDALANYLEARSFLARALWHGGSFDEAIEQAMHCFEVDPEDPAVRADLFVMLFDTDRQDLVIAMLDSFQVPSTTEDLYHRALVALLDDPESKEAQKKLRKAVSHNPYLASRFLGEDPKKAKRSSVEEGDLYEAAYGFLWRREDQIFDLLEEIVLAKR